MYSKISSSSSSAPASSISAETVLGNDDLLIEILVFVPALSLVRLKLVSKRWWSLISAPLFCRRHAVHHHRLRSETQLLLILPGGIYDSKYLVCDPTVTVPRLFPLPLSLEFPSVEILQFCNGLILLRCRKGYVNPYRYYVLNPTTMQQRELSPLPSGNAVGGIYLMFDPSLSPYYRVVCFSFAKEYTLTLIYVYDSETHKWKLGGEHNQRASCFHSGIYCNGGIYFLTLHYSSSSRFIPDDNSVSKIPNPTRNDYSCDRKYFMESNGNLVYLILSWERGIIVYEMKKNENKWTDKYHAAMNPIMASRGGLLCLKDINLVAMIRGEKEQAAVLQVEGKIMIYRFYDNGFEVVVDLKQLFQEKGRCYRYRDAHFVIQSLAPV